jgi:predicted NBD/HSP70 family sugar kinase
MPSYSIGVDLGGTNLRAAAVSPEGVILETLSGRSAIQDGPGAVVGDMVASIEELRTRMKAQTLVGIGVGVPGFIRLETGVIAGWGRHRRRDYRRRTHSSRLSGYGRRARASYHFAQWKSVRLWK